MLELLKNKIMIIFMVFVLGVVYVDSVNMRRLEKTSIDVEKDNITINVK